MAARRGARGQARTGTRHGDAGLIPFWAHQLAELLLGLVVMTEGVRRGGDQALVLAALGVVVVVVALVTRGPVAAWPRLSRAAHRRLDALVAVVAAASPLALGVHGATSVVAVELLAVVLVWLVVRTSWTEPVPRPARAGRADGRTDATAASEATGAAARRTGYVVGRARAVGPYRLGRVVGRARRRPDA